MLFRMKLAVVAVTGATAVGLLAAAPSLASTHARAAKSVTGPEVIAGALHGKKALANSPVIPLQWRGLVDTHSVVNLGGSGPHKGSVKTFPSPAGNLTLRVISKPTSRSAFSPKTCRFSFTEDISAVVVSSKSTGAFADATGPGAVQVSFSARAPRFKSGPKKGQCNPNGRPIASSASANFLASLVLTLKQ